MTVTDRRAASGPAEPVTLLAVVPAVVAGRGVHRENVVPVGQDQSGVRVYEEETVAVNFQVTFDCADPDRLARFWALALGYKIEDPPTGFDTWTEYWRSIGVPEEELSGDGSDSIVDPDGAGPRIWFQKVPEGKVVKNRLHFDVHAGGGRSVPMQTRKERINAEADRLVRAGATRVRVLQQAGVDHYAVAMRDPEGNEFDIN